MIERGLDLFRVKEADLKIHWSLKPKIFKIYNNPKLLVEKN